MKMITSRSRQNFFTIITIIGLLIIFSFYFFIYVPRKESNLQKENFRVLTKITKNIEDRVNDYKQYINDRARISVLYSVYDYEENGEAKSIFHNKYSSTLSRYFLQGRQEIDLIYFCPVTDQPDQELIHKRLAEQPKPYLLFVRDTCSYAGIRFEYGFTLSTASIQFLMQEQTFESYFLRRDDKIVFGPNAGLLAGAEDSLLKSMNGIETGRLFTQEISGTQKKIFAQPFHLGTEDRFVLCGMIGLDEYRKETLNFSGTIILIILLVLFLLALSLPFVKFLLMSRNERLNIADALLAGITVILGTAVIMLILLDTYTYYVPEMEARRQQLTKLSDEVSNNFEKEISSACKQLDVYDSLIGKDSSRIFMQNIFSIRDSAFLRKSTNPKAPVLSQVQRELLSPDYYRNFTQVFWTDSTGEQLFKWSSTSAITPLIRVDERIYFKNIYQNKVWSLPGNEATDFYLEGVYSWTTGENMAVIAKRSDHRVIISNQYLQEHKDTLQTRMIAMTTVMNSVMEPILPMSNGFCILDKNGNVIFHSDGKKNLAENFLDECSASVEIQSAMYSRTPNFFSTSYDGGDYKMYIRPINKLPFYLVTFQDNLFPITSNTEVLSLSVLLVIFFFLFICMQVVVLRLIKKRDSLLKAKTFSFDWLLPAKEKKEAYQHILAFLVPSFLVLLFFLNHAGPVETLFIFFVSSVFTFALFYLKIDQYDEHGNRKPYNEFFSATNNLIIAASLLILIVLNMISVCLLDHSARFTTYQIILAVLAVLILIFRIPVIKTFSFRRSYLVIQLGIISLISIIPTFAFFRISFEKEAEIRIRHVQLELAAELNSKSDNLNKSYNIGDSLQKDIYTGSFYQTRFLPTKFQGIAQRTNSISMEEDVFSSISVALTPAYNDIVTKEHDLANSPNDGSWKWKKKSEQIMQLYYYDLQKSSAAGVDTLTIQSEIPAYKLPLPFGSQGFGVRGILFWIGILFCVVALFYFIRFFVRIIFTTDFFRNNQFNKQGIVSLKGYFNSTNVFLVGSPHSGKTKWLKKEYIENKTNYHLNLNSLKTLEDVNAHLTKCAAVEVIIIDQFEYGFRDFAVARRRLRLFEGLSQMENKRILVVSNIHPMMFLREYPKQIPKQADASEESKSVAENKSADDRDRWTIILGGFHKIYFPASGVMENERLDFKDVINRECNNSYFLRSQKKVIRESIEAEQISRKLSDEEIILRIESFAHVYYNSIWSSLSEEEQYILYDISQDGLVNLKNREVLTMLLNKGLLIYDNKFRLMNESFRNFVLSEVSTDDALTLERNVKETGSWNYFKTPVVIVLITIALFIFITQQETFNSIIAFITTFAAGIPIVFRLLGMITSMKGAKVGN